MDGEQIIKLISTLLDHGSTNSRRAGRRVRERRQMGRRSYYSPRGRPRGWHPSGNFGQRNDSGQESYGDNDNDSQASKWSWEAKDEKTHHEDRNSPRNVQEGSSENPIILADENRTAWLQDCIRKIDSLKSVVERSINANDHSASFDTNDKATKTTGDKASGESNDNSKALSTDGEMDVSSLHDEISHQRPANRSHSEDSRNLAERTEDRPENDGNPDHESKCSPESNVRLEDNNEGGKPAKRNKQATRGKIITIISPAIIPTPKN